VVDAVEAVVDAVRERATGVKSAITNRRLCGDVSNEKEYSRCIVAAVGLSETTMKNIGRPATTTTGMSSRWPITRNTS
jgi:hypothetical protein